MNGIDGPEALPTILVAEPNADDFLLLHRAFAKCGMPNCLKWARDGNEAIELLNSSYQGRPSLIVSALLMPCMTGFELARRIGSSEEFHDIRFVILTSSDRAVYRQEAEKNGIKHYIVKPASLAALIDVVKRLRTIAEGVDS